MSRLVLKLAVLFTLFFSSANLYSQTQLLFESIDSGNWSNTAIWQDANGNHPVTADFTSGNATFKINEGHAIVVDANLQVSSINVFGTMTIGNSAVSRSIVVNGNFNIGSFDNQIGEVNVGNFEATHSITLKGTFNNSGSVNLRNNSAQVANVIFENTALKLIDGYGTTTVFNNIEVTGDKTKVKLNTVNPITVTGVFCVKPKSEFNIAEKTMVVGGSFTIENGGKFIGNEAGTLVLNSRTVQTISAPSNSVTLMNLVVNGGGTVVVSNNIYVKGNFLLTNNSTFNSNQQLFFYKNFTIDAGSKYEVLSNYTCFFAGNADNVGRNMPSDQEITINGEANFYGISCRTGANGGVKTFKGSLSLTAEMRAWGKTHIKDDSDTYNHVFCGVVVEGSADFKSPIKLTGGTLRVRDGNGARGHFSLGSSAITIEGGVYVRAGDTLKTTNNVTVKSGYLVLSGSYTTKVNGEGGTATIDTTWTDACIEGNGANTLTVENSTSLYVRGRDNFPNNFATVACGATSSTVYDSKMHQLVRGGNYGNLYLYYNTKKVIGDINVANHIYMQSVNGDSLFVDFGSGSHTVGYNINDNYDANALNRRVSLRSTGTMTFKCAGNHEQRIYNRYPGEYQFHNLNFVSENPTYAQAKYINGNIKVTGTINVQNSSTNEVLYLALDLITYNVIGNGGAENKLILGNNTRIRSKGATNFKDLVESFSGTTLHKNSMVHLNGAVEQAIPSVTYGNLYLSGSSVKRLESSVSIHGWINDGGDTPIFTVAGTTPMQIDVYGDWLLEPAYVDIADENIVVFCGENQIINNTVLPNVEMRGNGVKTITGNLKINGNLKLYQGIEVNSDYRNIEIYGDWINEGADFHQNYARTTFAAIGKNQIVDVEETKNKFCDIYLAKGLDDEVQFVRNTHISRNFVTATDKGSINIGANTLTIGGDLYMYPNCRLEYTNGAMLHFNGSETEQLIRNYNTEIIYPTLKFSGTAVKRPYDNTFDIDGDVIIDNNAIVSSGYIFKVQGDWECNGTFNHTSRIDFDGENQKISSSTFNAVVFSGTGVKTLYGNINVNSYLTIDSLSTLDVSPDNGATSYNITIAGNWNNNVFNADSTKTGKFIARHGKVTMIGNTSNLYAGDKISLETGAGREGKSFYDLVISMSQGTDYIALYPLQYIEKQKNANGDEIQIVHKIGSNDIRIENDLKIDRGIFYSYWNNLYLGANLKNNGGTFSMNAHYSKYSSILLGGTAGNTYQFDPGTSKTVRQVVLIGGGKYNLMNDYVQEGSSVDSLLYIRNGEFCLNHHSITMNSGMGHVHIGKNGTLTIDDGAILYMYNTRALHNYGTLNLLGSVGVPAKIESRGTNHTYDLVMYGGKIAANNYVISGTRNYGLQIKGGTIDPVNNLKNGTFINSVGQGLLTLDGLDLGTSGITIENVSFNGKTNSPKYNVIRQTGVGAVTFVNSGGTYNGATYEKDNVANELINWTSLGSGFVWTNASGDKNWHNPNNWRGGQVPTAEDDVILNNEGLAGNYEICIYERVAEVKNLTLESCAKLLLNNNNPNNTTNAYGLTVNGNITMKNGSELVQTNKNDKLTIRGSWINSGKYTHNNNPAYFDLAAGAHQIVFQNTASLGAMIVDGDSTATLSVTGTINIKDSVVLQGAELVGNNSTINVEGDWIQRDGVFNYGSSAVYFCATGGNKTQKVVNGVFYSVIFNGDGTKEIEGNLTVKREFGIRGAAHVNAKSSYIYLNGANNYWKNQVGIDAFEHVGSGVVFVSGALELGDDITLRNPPICKPTLFNNIVFQGSSNKYIYTETFVKEQTTILAGVGVLIRRYASLTGYTDNSSLLMSGGTLYIEGEDNFPKQMKDIDLSEGSVNYRDSIDQVIYPTNYYSLYVQNDYRNTKVKEVTKRVLGDITVRGNLVVNDSMTTLVVDNHEITLTGTLSIADNGHQVVWGENGTLIHVGGDWNVSKNVTDFCNLYKHGSGYIQANNNWNIAGDFELDNETRLYTQAYTITCTGANKSFEASALSTIYSSIPDTVGPAFPLGFDSYILDETSTVWLNAATSQKLYSGVVYGKVGFNNSAVRNIYFDGDIYARNNFVNSQDATTIIDNGYNLYLKGAENDLRNYANPSNTVYLEGTNDQKVYAGGSYTQLNFNNLVLSGSGTKEIDETNIYIKGNLTIEQNAKFSSNDKIYFKGESIVNNGEFYHYGNVFNFCRENSVNRTQTINMGEVNQFYGITIYSKDTVNVKSDLIISNGVFTLGDSAVINLGSYTHNIATAKIELSSTSVFNATNANLIFNRAGNQYIPQLECKNISFAKSNTKYLTGILNAYDVYIAPSVSLCAGTDANNTVSIYVNGSWVSEGTFYSYTDTVFFETPTVNHNKVIASNSSYFNVVHFNKNQTSASTYKLLDVLAYKDGMVIGNGATLHLNGNVMIVGNDDPNFASAPYVLDGEYLYVEAGGELYVNEGASLQFSHHDGNTHLDVYGKLSLIGSPTSNAIITRNGGHNDRGTEINIKPGATIAAKYYQVQYVAPTGMVVENGAFVDPVNNFSNGIWSGMYTGTSYTSPVNKVDVINEFIYLIINAEYVDDTIKDISFIHGGTPVVGRHYNMYRDTTLAEKVYLGGTLNGTLASKVYEKCPDHNIVWPKSDLLTWTGWISSDWFDARNWQPMEVPNEDKSVIIPLVTNTPSIYKSGAECNNLTITNGALTLENGVTTPFVVHGSVDVQNGGVLAVEDNAHLHVKGDWNIASLGYFVANNGTVHFEATTGSVVITPRKSSFNNVVFDGEATFLLAGDINIDGNLDIRDGRVSPNTVGYIVSVKGDYIRSGGTFGTEITGFVKFDGENQEITNGSFSRVRFSNTGVKNVNGTFDVVYKDGNRVNNAVILEDNVEVKFNQPMTLLGNILIDKNATFNDCNLTHNFRGAYWSGVGNYAGNGKIIFDGASQHIYGGKFNNLELAAGAGGITKYIDGDVTVNKDFVSNVYALDIYENEVRGLTDASSFIMGPNTRIYVRGADNYPRFANYQVEKDSYAIYCGSMNQRVRAATYGMLQFTSNTTKTLEGEIVVVYDLYFANNGGVLNANNHNITVGRNWNNQYNAVFEPTYGKVIFNGDVTSAINLGVEAVNPFYDFDVDKASSDIQLTSAVYDVTIKGSLNVNSGKLYCYGGRKILIAGNFNVLNDGVVLTSGIYEMNRPSGTSQIKLNGSSLANLIINGGANNCTFVALDKITVTDNFTLQKGIFRQNGQEVVLGNSLDNSIIYGTYEVGPNGVLRIGDASSFVVKSGGVFSAIGNERAYAQVTNNTGRYFFNVEDGGTIKAKYYNFSNLSKQGIVIAKNAIIDEDYNFSNGGFVNIVAGGVCLDIKNSQSFEGQYSRIENISFANNPGGGSVNIRKTENKVGKIEVYAASGLLAGELYENDPNNIIDWTGEMVYIWTGARNSNWNDKQNWKAKIGDYDIEQSLVDVPNETSNVIIPTAGVTNFPIISTDSVCVRNIEIEKAASLQINNPNANYKSLIVLNDIVCYGNLMMSAEKDTIEVYGNWILNSTALFQSPKGTVVLSGVGVKTIQNQSYAFNNLVVNTVGTVRLSKALKVNGDFIIEQGTFDVVSSTYTLTVGGDFTNKGVFLAQAGKLIFNGDVVHNFDPGTSTYYDVEVLAGECVLVNNQLRLGRNLSINGGKFVVNNNTINIGDGSGSDNLYVKGTLDLGNNARVKMGKDANLIVRNGGKLNMIGTQNNEVVLSSQMANAKYAVEIESGATIAADWYRVENINVNGLHLRNGAIIDTDNNLSNGTFVNGATGGQYIWFENNLPTDSIVISNLTFNKGAKYNVRRSTASSGIVNICDANGVVAGYYFENDDLSATTGSVVWTYTVEVLYWKGGAIVANFDPQGNRWDNQANWDNQKGGGGVPNEKTRLFIPDVRVSSGGSGKDPLLNAGDDGKALAIQIFPYGSLTIGDGKNLTIGEALSISENATFVASDGIKASEIIINGQMANGGKFLHGGSSTVIWSSPDNQNIEMNGYPLYSFVVNNLNGSAITFTVEYGKSLVIENDFEIRGGTVNCNGGTLEVGGDFSNVGGSFIHGNGTVIMNGATAQTLSSHEQLVLNNVKFEGNGEKNINVDIVIDGNVEVCATVNAPTTNITCRGDWKGSTKYVYKNNFHGGTGWVYFVGNRAQTISKEETFTNVKFSNTTSGTAFTLTKPINIVGEINLDKGIISGGASSPVRLTSTATLTGGDKNCYIIGKVERTGSSAFTFPIGSTDRYAPLAISAVNTMSTYSAEYYSSSPNNRNSMAEGINIVSDKEFWNFLRVNGTENPQVSMYWYDRAFSEINDFEVLSAVAYTGGLWTKQGDIDITPLDADTIAGYLTTKDPISVYGHYTFGFTYPTIVWIPTKGSSEYYNNDNWTGRYLPSNVVNIRIPNVNTTQGEHYPIVTDKQHCYDMTVESGGIIKVDDGAMLEVHGNAIIKSGAKVILGERASIYFDKDVEGDVNAIIEAGKQSTVYINGKRKQEVALNSCYNIVFVGADTYANRVERVLNSDINVAGSVNIDNNAILNMNGKTVTLHGDWKTAAVGRIDSKLSTLVLCGTSRQQIDMSTSSQSLNNVIINNTSIGETQIGLKGIVNIDGVLTLQNGVIQSSSNDKIKINSTASIAQKNKESYVIGPMVKEGSSNFVFPIGTSSVIGKIEIKQLGGTNSVFEAEYYTITPTSPYSLGSNDITNVSLIEHWRLARKSGNIDPIVTLYWQDTAFSKINDHSKLRVAIFESGKWVNKGNAGSNLNSDNSGSVSSANKIQFLSNTGTSKGISTLAGSSSTAILTFASTNFDDNPLPIELSSFEVVNVANNDIAINWETESETNNDYFTIEHIYNNVTETVDVVAAKGFNNNGATYSYLHINQEYGTHYYRLLQTDTDGTTTVAANWTSVIINNSDMPELQLAIAPNPGRCSDIKFDVSGIVGETLRYVVADICGKVVIDNTINVNQYQVRFGADTWNLPQSVYVLKIFTDNGQITQKFVVE